jgi:hypothetical protein
VHADDRGSFADGTGGQDVVVSVAPELAERVVAALAVDEVKIRAGVLAGPRDEPLGALPDLTPCAGSGR